ncbi:MAG: DNA translocase FtsK [Chloroflexi bacterium]|nr:DNA translocase FtsK [Chloroflexota bacterium]
MFFLRRWMGDGSYLASAFIGLVGLFTLRRHFTSPANFHLGRILASEGLLFTSLALLSVWGGQSLERADAGLDGGLIGWGLAELMEQALPAPWSTVVWIVLFGTFLIISVGIIPSLARGLEHWLQNADEEPPAVPLPVEVPVQAPEPPRPKPAPEPSPQAPPQEKRKPALRGKGETKKDASRPVVNQRPAGLPPSNLLLAEQSASPDEDNIRATARAIEVTLGEFGIPVVVKAYRTGPTVTQFAVEPGFIEKTGPDGQPVHQKVRVAQISALSKDLALALSAERLRIEAPIPGQSFVGIEVPNAHSTIVRLRSLIESEAFQRMNAPLGIALGKNVSGHPLVADLGRMPHLLIAGTTGSGKSVAIAAITTCLVMNNTPDRLHLAMLDPKMVELVRFNGLPHLLGKVETEPERMLGVLRWALNEMDQRYRLLETAKVRDLEGYNRRMERRGQPTLPRIVVLIDELADLMMSAPDQTEHSLVRLAQLARATGMHLVVATQRPSTDILTGLIKANFPARLSFTVASSVDSRVILDMNGAETLLGRGDMLFLNPEVGTPVRSQGVMVTDHEVERVINFWKNMQKEVEPIPAPWEELISEAEEEGGDELVKKAIQVVKSSQRASASLLQRRLRIGYPRAARLIDELEELGVIGPAQSGGREREVLWSPDDDIDGVPDDVDEEL